MERALYKSPLFTFWRSAMADSKLAAKFLRAMADAIEAAAKPKTIIALAIYDGGSVQFVCPEEDHTIIGPAIAELEQVDITGMTEDEARDVGKEKH
jgi:hypothetical protein